MGMGKLLPFIGRNNKILMKTTPYWRFWFGISRLCDGNFDFVLSIFKNTIEGINKK